MRSELLFTAVSILCLAVPSTGWANQEPLRVLIDVRSQHSDGAHSFPALIDMAKMRGIQAVAFTEHDRQGIRFGLEPVPQVLGYTIDRPSLYTTGLKAFFADVAAIRQQYPHMVLFAGTESTAGYRWSGVPFINLALHDADRHLIALGLDRAEQIEALPSYDLRHACGSPGFSLLFWCVSVGLALVLLLKRHKPAAALLLAAAFTAVAAGWAVKEKVDADADFIATAHKQGLFSIWAHPGTHSGVRPGPMGVKLDTQPYSRRVFSDPTADAFAAVYGDTDLNTRPGGVWDRYMIEFMQGLHPRPIWGVAAGDFHAQGEAGEYLGNFPMDVWVDTPTEEAVLAAMRKGRMVAWGLPRGRNLRVKMLFLDDGMGHHLLPGDTAVVGGRVVLYCALDEQPHASHPPGNNSRRWHTQLIVDGRVVAQPPVGLHRPLRAALQLAPGAHVVRLRIPAQHAIRMEANPFLLRVRG